jgi:DNA-directed RNA polymerase subunit RPC12/RpoP
MIELFCPTCGKSIGFGPKEADGIECWPCTFKTMDNDKRDLLDTLMMNTQDEEVITL